ncbi:MAG: death-on-curing protein [Desulfobulbaceae bacterium A2]|nr:MAG: death-on-curing protein [Desulfobulbaceae bacterium A2]
MTYRYLTIEQAIDTHALTVEKSGGGTLGVLEIDKLASVLTHIQNDDYYPSFEEKLTHLFFCTCKFHCFQDGNKRIAITLCAQMLLINGYLFCSDHFIREAENISYHVAAGNISKELLGRWMQAILNVEEDDESLKLDIYHAISGNTP